MKILRSIVRYIIEITLAPLLFFIAILGRYSKKSIDIGLGPEPLINNIYHKQALELYGYTAQTFVTNVYFITDKFDIRGDRIFSDKYRFSKFIVYL